MRNKQANIGKLLASLGLGGLIGGGIGRVSGYGAGNQAGYSEGSANASKDTLINLLKGMTGVVQQGAESKLDLKKLLESKSGSLPSIPIAPINAASVKTAGLRNLLYRLQKTAEGNGLWANIRAKKKRGESAAKPGDKDYPDSKNWKKVTAISEKSATEKQAIAALIAALKGGSSKAMTAIEQLMGKAAPRTPFIPRGTLNTGLEAPSSKLLSLNDISRVPLMPKGSSGVHPLELPKTDLMHKLFMLNQKHTYQR